MNEIKRFNHQVCEYPGGTFSEINQEADGDYVLHSDHEAEVARLRAEVENLHAKLDRKEGQRKLAESECASMRKDSERRLDLIRATLENTEWRHGARNIYAELCREVDAAMGASA